MHDHSYRVGLARSLLLAAVAVAALMAGFEVLKQFLFPRISLWQSHAATIVFSTIVATLATYLLGRKLIASNAKLQDDIRKREWMSKALEQSEARYRSLFERNQAGVSSRAYRPGPYSPYKEYNVDRFVQWYLKQVRSA